MRLHLQKFVQTITIAMLEFVKTNQNPKENGGFKSRHSLLGLTKKVVRCTTLSIVENCDRNL
jgi:hypothetical protein